MRVICVILILVSTNILHLKIIKLNAIGSTNSFLKEMVQNKVVENFTTVITHQQTAGRGQIQTKWVSEPNKNLTFSVFCTLNNLPISEQKYLNFAVSVSVFEAVNMLKVPKLAIKWPNDILSEKQKICGVLIENSLKGSKIVHSIIGIGLNVNQEIFPDDVPNASSIKNILKKETDLDDLLNLILKQLQENIKLLNEKQYSVLEEKYLSVLYKRNIPSMFKNSREEMFMGKIIGISSEGKLQIELDDETIKEFGLKEVSFVV